MLRPLSVASYDFKIRKEDKFASRSLLSILVVLLAACVSTPAPAPVPTLAPTDTRAPTETILPTRTPMPADTLTIAATRTQTGTPTRTATPTIPVLPTPTGVTFKFDDGVSQDQRDTIATGIAMGRAFLGDSRPITVIAFADLNGEMDELSRFFNEPRTSPRLSRQLALLQADSAFKTQDLIVFPMSKNWQAQSQVTRLLTAVHEYFHVVESYLSQTDPFSYSVPQWLYEGTADFAAYHVLARYGYYDLGMVHRDKTRRTLGVVSPISSMEITRVAQRESDNTPYDFGYLADEILMEISSEQALLQTFWENYPKYPGWQLVFKATFGITEEEFYKRFEDKRRAEFPPLCGTQGLYTAPGPNDQFNLKLVRQDPPGALLFPLTTWTVSRQPLYSYTFCSYGYSIGLLTDLDAFKFPPRSGAVFCGGSCITLYFTPGAQGLQIFAIDLPDKRHAEVQFQHSVPPAATPKP